jgi:hypothetical protein
MVEELVPGIWTAVAPFKLAGVEFGTRMTIVQIGDDGLALISPCPIDEVLAAELRTLGTVRALIAPNAFHYLYLMDAAERYPDAALFVAEGVAKKLANLPPDAITLSAESDPLWKAELEQCRLEGAPMTNEVIFFHRPSQTLILTDLCFNFDPPPQGWAGIFLRLMGVHGRLAVSRLMRFALKDRAKVRPVIQRILDWDFERIIVTHGAIVTRDAHRLFREATAGL